MCFTVTPGSNGIRAAHYATPSFKPSPAPASYIMALLRRPIETVPVFSGERQSMSYTWVRDDVCRVYRCSRRGQAARKRQHKPCWRTNYIEHFDNY